MISKTDAYNIGFASGKRAGADLQERIKSTYAAWKQGQPGAADIDIAAEVLKLDQERISNPPSLARYPETRGWPDLVIAERKGYADATGGGAAELAFRYTSFYFHVYRLYTRYVGKPTSVATPVGISQCTSVFFRDSKEG